LLSSASLRSEEFVAELEMAVVDTPDRLDRLAGVDEAGCC
jgi:hypothetical protein